MSQSILFVCMGNICRSPTAEGVFRKIAEAELSHINLRIDSAGTIGYHAGEHADSRAISAAKRRGYDLSSIISRQVRDDDFESFDLILAMDDDNYFNLVRHAEQAGMEKHKRKIQRFLDYSRQDKFREVPDPYYGGAKGFDLVIDLIEDATFGLVEILRQHKS